MRPVTVVVVSYGSAALLRENLAPLTRSAPHLSVVVVDNRTDDAERALLVALAAGEGWATVLPDSNTGFGGGMNLGVARALDDGADRLLLLNPDATVDQASVEGLAAVVDEEALTLAAPRILRPDGSVWFAGSDLYLADGRIRSRRRRLDGAEVEEWLSGACLMLSRELWEVTGGFDEGYFLYWEDVDLSHRVRAAGGALRVVEEATAVHAQGGTQGSAGAHGAGEAKSATYYRYNIRNRLLFAARHLDTPTLVAWRRLTPRVAWEVLLQGGRRQFVTSPGTLLVGLRAVLEGRGIAAQELRRRARP
ncbi:glycosyltransferase family 2 protein [Frondihabitans australicus]|uniref:GT2 family glycosyltransferase n=1 Tax=Frondihabitans australicus TaxID=386892 RepID=A0A495IBS8_9MICO|nr:glycosyltransferase family 2 protein [Frondihabitans australicus]RKR72938.1 GT2 family glycosyltransferase [Frondihabitans australicus]